jgi:uncharacterized protein (DUF2235 family)
MQHTARTILILCDGTSNQISGHRSNILRLYGTLTKSPDQLVYYDPGVGTFEAGNAWSEIYRKIHVVWGMATGWGIDRNVLETYEFLVQNLTGVPDEKLPEVNLVFAGFSRGAYTVRVLAGFLTAFGLLRPENLNLLPSAYQAYKRLGRAIGGPFEGTRAAFEGLAFFRRMTQPRALPVAALALFDTVSSVVEPNGFRLVLRKHAYTASNPGVRAVRHAVAIDERRRHYRPRLWDKGDFRPPAAPRQPQDVKEVWFVGAHGDVGGGYSETESGLAKIPLHWMIEELKGLGVAFDQPLVNQLVLGRGKKKYAAPDPIAQCHDEMRGVFRLLEYLPQKVAPKEPVTLRLAFGIAIPKPAPRTIPRHAVIHHSAEDRANQLPDYRPENLPR